MRITIPQRTRWHFCWTQNSEATSRNCVRILAHSRWFDETTPSSRMCRYVRVCDSAFTFSLDYPKQVSSVEQNCVATLDRHDSTGRMDEIYRKNDYTNVSAVLFYDLRLKCSTRRHNASLIGMGFRQNWRLTNLRKFRSFWECLIILCLRNFLKLGSIKGQDV